jgi:autotransporter-associated beta strand protein
MNRRSTLVILSILSAAWVASAQSVWTGGGGNARWSTADNWQGGVAPAPGPLTSLTFGGSVTDAQSDFLSGAAFSNLTFAAGAAPFTLSGNGFGLYGTLVNSSSVQQRIGNDLVWIGRNRTLDTGAGGIALDGFFSSGATNACFVKNGTGTLTLHGGGNFNVVDPPGNFISSVNAGTVVITKDINFNRLDLKGGARLIVTNSATLSGFTGNNYVFWQDCTVDLYSGRIVIGSTLLTAQDWSKTSVVNVRGGVFVGSGDPRWSNNGNTLLTLSGDGEFQWLSGRELAENGGCWLTLNGGLFKRGATGGDDFDVGYRLTGTKRETTVTNRIAFNAGVFLTGSFTYTTTKTNLLTTLLFNGGTVRAGKSTTTFFGVRPHLIASTVGAGGLVFDTQGYAVTLNDALETGGGSDGGLTKLGAGTLTLATNCTYTGATTVSNGLLRIDAPLASSALRLAPYASAVLASATFFSGGLTVEQGATFAFTTNATTSLTLSGLTTGGASGVGKLVFEITGETTLDQLSVSGALDFSMGGDVLLYQPGTTTRFAANGSYPLIAYSGTLTGSTDSLRVANPNPAKLYQFSAAGGVITLTITDGTAAQWISETDGVWSESANWAGGVPNAAAAAAQFLGAASAPLTVTLDAPATVGSLIFDNASAPYTLAGGETLTLDADTQPAVLLVQAGTHTVAAPLALAGAASAQPEAGASLTLAGGIAGVGPLTVTGAGNVSLTGTNQTQTLVLDGALSINDGASLAGGTYFDNGTLTVTADTAVGTAVEIGPRDATVQPASGVTATLAASPTGAGTLRKAGAGTLALAAALANAGGALVSAGTLAFTNDVFGAAPLKLGGGAARFTGAVALTLGAPVTVSANATLRTEQAPLTLAGTLAFGASATLALESADGLTLAGSANSPDSGRKIHLRGGTLTLASGADYTLSSGARDTVKLGQDSDRQTELVIEPGARLKTGGIHMNTTLANATNCLCTVRQEGGAVEITHSDGLFIRDYGLSDATYLMNGGTFLASANSWANIGSKGHGYLTVNGGAMTLGRLSMGVTDNATYAYNGPGGHLAVNGGRLTVAGSCSWMSDAYAGRYNTAVLGNGTPDQGELNLVATTRSVPYTNGGGRTAFTFNGGLLKAIGLAPYGTSTLTNYLNGVDTLTLRSGGALIETPGADITITQPLRAADTAGGVVKRGMAALTLPATHNAWCGLTDVQAGTLRARLNQAEQRLYPEGLLALWSFDDGTPADQSGNGFDLVQQNDTTLVAFVDGGACGQAARFSGLSSLKMPYNAAFNIGSFSVSAWVNIAALPTTHQGIFSTRVDTGETSANGTFDFKINGYAYPGEPGNTRFISNFNNFMTGVPITAAMGGNLETGTWHMVTYVVQPGRIDAYLNGVWRNATNIASAVSPTLLTPGHLLTIGRGHSSPTEPVREMMGSGGMIDDVAVFARALSADEVAALYETTTPRPPVRVAEAAALDLLGTTNVATAVSGGGTISNGVLVVTESLTPESDAGAAVLTVENLAFDGTNVTYACATDDLTNALLRVTGTLAVTGGGVIALGHTAENPVTTPFRRTVMTYGALDPADAAVLASWAVTGDGVSGSARRTVIVDDTHKRVEVEIRHVGTLLLVH